MTVIITNAFSLNMLARKRTQIHLVPLTRQQAREFLEPAYKGDSEDWQSAVGHPDTAAIFSEQLGQTIEPNRTTVALEQGVRLLVGQYTGPRLQPGATTLPDGAEINWWLVYALPPMSRLPSSRDV